MKQYLVTLDVPISLIIMVLPPLLSIIFLNEQPQYAILMIIITMTLGALFIMIRWIPYISELEINNIIQSEDQKTKLIMQDDLKRLGIKV